MKKNLIIFTVFTAMFFMVGCHKLQWSNRSPEKMNWPKAIDYCRNLNEGGYSNWRLPDIDELRTLIKNCPKTETGGECKWSEKNGILAEKRCFPVDTSCFCEEIENSSVFGLDLACRLRPFEETDECICRRHIGMRCKLRF